MINEKSFLAIIPARGGSKRLPRKNLIELGGKPLITWTIEAALRSKYIDKVIVTTDDTEILSLASTEGSDVIKRPKHLASDTSTTIDVIIHVISNLRKNYNYIVLLQPTSPLRSVEQIDQAIELLVQKEADGVISVCEMSHNPLWSNTLPESESMEGFIDDEVKNKRSQDLDTYYRLNGAIYICDTKKLMQEKTFFLENNVYAYKMKKENSIDIDEKIDLEMAKAYLV